MTASEQIVFEVETGRILAILAKEIYDAPQALLRENVQNAYDAILMRCAESGEALAERTIDVRVEGDRITIEDDGIGMNATVLKENFWKAGSSGKKTALALRAGVVGTFGIGAMANFGVCKSLRVETRTAQAEDTLISSAVRDELRIGRECIRLERVRDGRAVGTRLVAELDASTQLTPEQATAYLQPYVRFLPVRVVVNDELVSQGGVDGPYESQLATSRQLGVRQIGDEMYAGDLTTLLAENGSVIARLSGILMQGQVVAGELFLVQNGGQLMGYRNFFGLAPIPIGGHFHFGGAVNLGILQPTAGREALTRESIERVHHLVRLCEVAVAEAIAPTDAADKNLGFLQFIHSQSRPDLAGQVRVDLRPDEEAVALAEVSDRCKGKATHFYAGRDQKMLQTFGSGDACLLHLTQANPRRAVQHRYITEVLRITEVPDSATVTKTYCGFREV